METNALEAFHEAMVELQHRISRTKVHIGMMDWPDVKKRIEVANVEMLEILEESALRSYWEVWND